jgi:branched-subunit amino acid transport protein
MFCHGCGKTAPAPDATQCLACGLAFEKASTRRAGTVMMGESPAAAALLPPRDFTRRSSAPPPVALATAAQQTESHAESSDNRASPQTPALGFPLASPPPPLDGAPLERRSVDETPLPERPSRTSVDAVIDTTNGAPGAPMTGLVALILVTLLGPFGGALWLTLVRRDVSTFLRRDVDFASALVPFLSFFTFGIVGALWRTVVLAPIVEEVQTRAGVRAPSVNRLHYALPFVHAVFVQEDLAAAWVTASTELR